MQRSTSIDKIFGKTRYDFFVIWGPAMQNEQAIIKSIKSAPDFQVLRIMDVKLKNLKKTLRVVNPQLDGESYRTRIKFLKVAPRLIRIVFVKNCDVHETWPENGNRQYAECARIRNLLTEIRSQHQPSDIRGVSEDRHAIDASKNQAHTDSVIRFLGFGPGSQVFHSPSQVLESSPYHLKRINAFTIKKVKIDDLFTTVVLRNKSGKQKVKLSVKSSPHYKFVQEENVDYEDYYKKNRGVTLKDPHFPEDFRKLAFEFSYLTAPAETGYILVGPPVDNQYPIKDGAHRAAILASQNKTEAYVAILS